MSSPTPPRQPCCPIARHWGTIALVVFITTVALILRADEKPDDKSAPPKDAVVLFDGKDLSKWQKYPAGGDAAWKLVDGAMEVAGGDIITRDKFRDMKLHLEFMPPYMPDAHGQARGNSGVFVMDNYEVQVLDSYGLPKLEVGDCAALYSKKVPDKNAAKPPAQWQTYDIEFKAPRFDAAGKKTTNARITVYWNGQKVHDNVELDGPLPGGSGERPEGGGIRLQDHGNPVRYRNIWVVPIRD
jgi:3-keto-disaccharide hydrolase